MPRRKKMKIEEAKAGGERPRGQLKYPRLRGMKDILFDEYKYWDLVYKKATELARVYGFKRIETPILERLELYERATGKSTDIVSKEMYSFVDKNGEKVALRPEATPGLVRTYIEHGMLNLPQPVKMFWLGPVFRHDKPQAGRYRQFNQFDLEIFGDATPIADVILILVAYNFFRELQIAVQIQINSIGCKECREQYIEKLLNFYKERGKRAKLCYDCKKRLVKNPLRLLDCKEEVCIKLREDAPQIVDSLCDSCRDHFIKVLEYLDELEIPYNLNPYLVRGLDYYNRTVFEVWPVEEDGEKSRENRAQSALGGGGRYDNLMEYMGGRETPACGFGLGIERTVLLIREKNIPLKKDDEDYIFIAQLGEQARRKAMNLFEEMRRSGFKVRQLFTKDSLKAQLEEADRVGAKYSLILGQKELMDGTILLRDMESGIQEVIDYKKINADMEKRLSEKNKQTKNGENSV
ncbi:MAG: histidine--tRNA ligase [Patescibacteria group bacterium]|nr:histidine--tRNA ligase [Patescibacteria group bacterium]MDD4611249.1 histidine--tRNA ligase [Patescibacteria group bacterium]